jgi:hypothetical protein
MPTSSSVVFSFTSFRRASRRIRHFGFLANACRADKLAQIRCALQAPEPTRTAEPAGFRERYATLTGHRIE